MTIRASAADIAELEAAGAVVGPTVGETMEYLAHPSTHMHRCEKCETRWSSSEREGRTRPRTVACPGCGWKTEHREKEGPAPGWFDRQLKALCCCWTLAIGGFHPAALNTLMGHHMHRAKLKAHDRDIIGRAVLVYGVPRATGKRRVGLHVVLAKGQRAADSDAYHKSLLDSLKHSGAIMDDNRQGVELMPVQFSRGDAKGCFITLEEMP